MSIPGALHGVRRVKTLAMTGGTSGIGRHALEQLLQSPDWRVLLLARPSPRTVELEARYAASGRLEIVPVDLASLASVAQACEAVSRRGASIDALALNAGIQELGGHQISGDGLELTFAVNHLAHFAIACALLGRMPPGARVVITASEVHDPDAFCMVGIARAVWQDPLELADVALSQAHLPAGTERGEARYSASKLLNVMHARMLAAEHRHLGVVAFNPSVVPGTEIARERNIVQQFLWKRLLPLGAGVLPGLRTVRRSADDLIWLLTEADLSAWSGSYVDGRTVLPGSADSRDAAKIARLRAVSLQLLASAGVGAIASPA